MLMQSGKRFFYANHLSNGATAKNSHATKMFSVFIPRIQSTLWYLQPYSAVSSAICLQRKGESRNPVKWLRSKYSQTLYSIFIGFESGYSCDRGTISPKSFSPIRSDVFCEERRKGQTSRDNQRQPETTRDSQRQSKQYPKNHSHRLKN